MKILSLLLITIFGWTQYLLWYGKNNLHEYWQLKESIVAHKALNSELRLRNDKQFAEIKDLYDGESAIEERARAELGLVKPGEHFYRIISDD